MLDPVSDPFGLALYLEGVSKPHETEAEAKVLLDKKAGNLLIALNFVGEREWKYEETGNIYADSAEVDLGIAYLITPRFSLGFELRHSSEKPECESFDNHFLYGGSALSYASKNWWLTMTVLPQISDYK